MRHAHNSGKRDNYMTTTRPRTTSSPENTYLIGCSLLLLLPVPYAHVTNVSACVLTHASSGSWQFEACRWTHFKSQIDRWKE
jgi:hypothetical protein